MSLVNLQMAFDKTGWHFCILSFPNWRNQTLEPALIKILRS